MALKSTRYTPGQIAEACRLVNEEGIGPAQARLTLAEGSNGLAPFDMPKETIRKYARDDRSFNAPDLPAGEEANELAKRAIDMANQELNHLHTAIEKGKRDPAQVDKWLTVIDHATKMRRDHKGDTTKNTPSPLDTLPKDATTHATPIRTPRATNLGSQPPTKEPGAIPEQVLSLAAPAA